MLVFGKFAWSGLKLFLPELRIVGKIASTLEEHSWMNRNTVEATRQREGSFK